MTESINSHDHSKRHSACNINSRGKMFRLIAGVLLLLITLMLVVLVVMSLLTGAIGWWLVGVTFLSGCLLVYEGWSGWCVLRAMGIPTPV